MLYEHRLQRNIIYFLRIVTKIQNVACLGLILLNIILNFSQLLRLLLKAILFLFLIVIFSFFIFDLIRLLVVT